MIELNYHHLYYFFVIAKEGSIAKACKKLYLAQPTLSTQLKQFEKFLNKKLFERHKQRLSLTDDGRLVLDYAESIFELGSELKDTLNDRARPGHMAIQIGILNGTPRSFAQALLESILDYDSKAEIHVKEAVLDHLLSELKEHRLDVVMTDTIVRGHERDELTNHQVGKIPVVFAATPSLARKVVSFPSDLQGAPMILPSLPSQVYHQVLDVFEDRKVKPRIFAEVQDIELARRLALSGRGIAVLNAYSASVSLPKKGLSILPMSKELGIYESVYLVLRKRKVAHPLVEHLVKNFKITAPLI